MGKIYRLEFESVLPEGPGEKFYHDMGGRPNCHPSQVPDEVWKRTEQQTENPWSLYHILKKWEASGESFIRNVRLFESIEPKWELVKEQGDGKEIYGRSPHFDFKDGDTGVYVGPDGELRVADMGTKEHLDQKCRVCGCTDNDCSQCIKAQGYPCRWVEKDLCSRCATPAFTFENGELLLTGIDKYLKPGDTIMHVTIFYDRQGREYKMQIKNLTPGNVTDQDLLEIDEKDKLHFEAGKKHLCLTCENRTICKHINQYTWTCTGYRLMPPGPAELLITRNIIIAG